MLGFITKMSSLKIKNFQGLYTEIKDLPDLENPK